MTFSELSSPERAFSTRLQHFKDACAEQCKLETRILELMKKIETAAVSTVHCAESELEKVRSGAAAVRAEMEETRRVYGISTVKSSNKPYIDRSSTSHPITQPLLPEGELAASCTAGEVPESPLSSSFRCITPPLRSGSESPNYPPSDLKTHSDVSDEITNTHGEDEGCHDEAVRMMVQRYIKVGQTRRSLEVEIEEGLAAEESMAIERIVKAKQSLKDMMEWAAEMASILNQAGGGNIFKLPSLESIAVEGKWIPSEMVAATSSPDPIVVTERADADHPAEKGDKSKSPFSIDPSSILAPHKPVESSRKPLLNPSANTINHLLLSS